MAGPSAAQAPSMLPDIAIIGTPKSGTSSLFDWLAAHPAVTGSQPDETHAFMDGDDPLADGQRTPGKETDLARFFPAAGAGQLRLEATPHHLYQQTAYATLAAGRGNGPHIVVVLREPAARLRSAFRFTQNNLAVCASALTFKGYADHLLHGRGEALEDYFLDAKSRRIAQRELAFGRYAEWLDWWCQTLPPERLSLILFEELIHHPYQVVTRLATDLGIDPAFYTDYDFPQRNATAAIAHRRLHRWARRIGPMLPKGALKRRLQAGYLRWQRRRATTEDPTEGEALKALRAYYAPHNRALETRYGLPLQEWWGQESIAGA